MRRRGTRILRRPFVLRYHQHDLRTRRRGLTVRPRVPFKNLAGPVPASSLRDGHAALLVVDVHRFTVLRDEGFARLARERGILRELAEYYEQLDQVIPNVHRLAETCRTHGVPVVFTRLVAGGPQKVAPQAAVTGFWARAGSDEADFLPDLRPRAEEAVIDKTVTGAFTATALHELLQDRGIRDLIVAGVLANGAVEQTARDAADLGYRVIVVSDACAGETWTIHGFVMTTLVGGLIRTRTTTAVVEMVEGVRA